MKRKIIFRLMAMLMALSLFAVLAAGCSRDDIRLFTALMNAEPVYSYESTARVEYTLEIIPAVSTRPYYYSDSTDMTFRILGALYEDAGFEMSVKSAADKDLNKVKQEILVTPRLLGGRLENLTVGLWADVDGSDLDNSNIYVLMPRLLSALSKDTAGKDYLTMNIGRIYELAGAEAGADFSKMPDNAVLVEQMQEIMKPINTAILKAALQMKPDELYVSEVRPYTDSNWQRGTIYTLNISDAGLKKLIRSVVNDIEKDTVKEILDALIDGSIAILGSYAQVSDEYEDMYDFMVEFKNELDEEFDSAYEIALMEINSFLDKFEKVKVLGPKGITFDVGIDANGFPSLLDGIIDISVDVAGFERHVLESRYPSDIKRFDFTTRIFYEMTRINKVVYVDMPNVTAANSVSVESLLEAAMEASPYLPDYYDYLPYDDGDDLFYDGESIDWGTISYRSVY